jgi:hypothetical protein
MPTSHQIDQAIKQVGNAKTFFSALLGKTLGWPTSDARQVDDIAYGWTQADLNAVGLEEQLVEGSVWQLQPGSTDQPWGIFVLEFKREDALSPRRGMAGVLRKVLKGLVSNQRKKGTLPSWRREHLLFVCTYNWTHFKFAYFRSKPDQPGAVKLATFGWDPASKNRTLTEFNLPALVWPDDEKDGERWTKAWARAFDKEPLTRDFFRRFNEALDLVKADLQNLQGMSSADAYTSAQLLLERLIFLYFLQNRGWLDQKRDYLTTALQSHTEPDSYSYYHQFLDKLFWTLSTAPTERGRISGIPFLNGGLFDDDEFRPPAELRKISPPLKVRNGTMRKVFDDFLEAFNFTVKEDTPLSQDVAVDPEMLGKVFESIILHAEAADPDAVAPDKRKDTGSYYTPRIVVHFICREALYQYLVNHLSGEGWGPRLRELLAFDLTDGFDETLKERLKATIKPEQARSVLDLVKALKCCDPAVGSGAFPVGLMQELVNLRRLLETALNGYKDPVISAGLKWLHDAKEHIVENCLFGVDIQQQAIEICRLRLWLSLIVDYDIGPDSFKAERQQFRQAIERMSQLPNLEMNFRRGDSLHDHVCGVPVVIVPDRTVRHFEEFKAISKLGEELHQAKKAEKKKRLRVAILEQRLKLSGKLVQEEIDRVVTDDSALDGLFGIEGSKTKKRERNQRELANLKDARASVEKDSLELGKLMRRPADGQFYAKLRKLEGADFNSPFNFAWYIDFPNVFGKENGGFDIVVGNPPFVTARNPQKRELWRQRWPRVCHMKYQLVCPFFELSTTLLKEQGELGFIVANAFMKREFGIPLVESFFFSVETQKIIDCSGLMFPGHGTPTCIVLLAKRKRGQNVRVVATLSGGGDLRTPPEESTLWSSISANHDLPGFSDSRIRVSDLAAEQVFHWPVNLDVDSIRTKAIIEKTSDKVLRELLATDVGFMFIVGRNEIFMLPPDCARRVGIEAALLKKLNVGDEVRDYTLRGQNAIIFPYDHESIKLLDLSPDTATGSYFHQFLDQLLNRPTFGGTFASEGRKPYAYHQIPVERAKNPKSIVLAQIATHAHFVFDAEGHAFNEKAPVLKLNPGASDDTFYRLTTLLNSSTALFWLKQVCFSKREAELAENDTYYEFAGGKVEQVPIPRSFDHRQFESTSAALGNAIAKYAKQTSSMSLYRFFSLASPYNAEEEIGQFASQATLKELLQRLQASSVESSQQMVALQEEMDWLLYAAYGLLPENHPAVQVTVHPERLVSDKRPFRLWDGSRAEYPKAVELIPTEWPEERRQLWRVRLMAIRDNEHIRRIEQAVYKRRWDEQWKIGNRWSAGAIAFAAECVYGFEFWLKEKAEWWLEHKKNGGPADLDEWTAALWADERVQAAWPVAAKNYSLLEFDKVRANAEEQGDPDPERPKPKADRASFARLFREIVDEETVPEGFEFGTEYSELEKKLGKKIPPKLVKVRGKLNVPRERFHTVGKNQYKWAGLQFGDLRSKVGGQKQG